MRQQISFLFDFDFDFDFLSMQSYIKQMIVSVSPSYYAVTSTPLKGLRVLDVGCGGGLSAESLARLGASVVAIDASRENIEIAKQHAARDPQIRENIKYLHSTAEKLLETTTLRARHSSESINGEQGPNSEHRAEAKDLNSSLFDAVISLEVIEHVADVHSFASSLVGLLKPGGALVLSTINRTPQSFFTTILGAEYIVNWVPRGTHTWSKFIKPEELKNLLERTSTTSEDAARMEVKDVRGMRFNPISFQFEFTQDLSSNYLLFAQKLPSNI